MPDRTCLDCGTSIAGSHGNTKRCPPCQAIAAAGAQSEHRPRTVPCSMDSGDCVPGRLRLGLCSRHYGWNKRNGSPTPPPDVDHFARYVVTAEGCWEWTGPLYEDTGYGHSPASTGDQLAHRAFYKRYVGPIPDGLDLDHQCHNRSRDCAGGATCRHRRCVNPADLEPATRSVNLLRGNEARRGGMCGKGLHPITADEDWYVDPSSGVRRCRACWQVSYRAAGATYRAGHRV